MCKNALENNISNAASAFAFVKVGTKTWNNHHLGTGYTMFSADDLLYNDDLPMDREGAISVMIAAGVHVNKVSGLVGSSLSRLAILAGLGIDKTRSGLGFLEDIGLLTKLDGDQIQIKRPGPLLGEDDFAVFQALVFRGVWAVLPFSAKKLLLYLFSKGRPFVPDHTYVGENKVYRNFAAQSRREDGRKMILPKRISLPEVEETLAMSSESRRSAMRFLHSLGLVEKDPGRDLLVLANVPPLVYPKVLNALAHARVGSGEIAGGTLRSIRNLGKRDTLVSKVDR